jgi:hypothetical protein
MEFFITPFFESSTKNLLLDPSVKVAEAKNVRVHFFDVILDQEASIAPVYDTLGQQTFKL